MVKNRSISRLVLFSIILVSIVPVVIIAPHIYKTAWNQQHQQLAEKHQQLAQNLSAPVQMYVKSHRQSLQILASTINQLPYKDLAQYQRLVYQSVHYLDGFNAIALLSIDGKLKALSVKDEILNKAKIPDYSLHPSFKSVLDNKISDISDVHASYITGDPVITLSQVVLDNGGKIRAILFAELDLEPIKLIQSKVRFGKEGHSAIVDSKGRVIAHPNPEWVREIRDISHWTIVQKMIEGQTGVMEFYSSFMKADMLAGYAGIKDLGWGIMVPQPKSEIVTTVNETLIDVMLWAIFGILIAILAAYFLSRWITKPINTLACNAIKLDIYSADGALDQVPEKSPREVMQLWEALSTLISRLRVSKNEIGQLNDSLQKKVNKATSELREANTRLRELSTRDYLTEIGNRRYFENALNKTLSNPSEDDIGVMLLDIDNFKQINDEYSHAAGDYVLTRVAEELHKAMRPGDIIARYGGDEFVAHFRCDEKTLFRRAEQLRISVEKHPISWQANNIAVTLSIGIISQKFDARTSIDELMSAADHAMYQSKNSGRNMVSKYH